MGLLCLVLFLLCIEVVFEVVGVGCVVGKKFVCIIGVQDCYCFVVGGLGECGIEWYEFVLDFIGIFVDCGEECGCFGQVEIGLVECDLCGVDWFGFFDVVFCDFLLVFGVG